MDISKSLFLSLSLPLGMGIGTLVLPILSDHFCSKNRAKAIIIPALIGTLAVFSFAFLSPIDGKQSVAINILLFISGFCIYSINGVTWTYALDIGGRKSSGKYTGIINFFCYLGAAVQSIIYGFLVEQLGWKAVFCTICFFCGGVFLLGLLLSIKEISPKH